jgi:hypothetical protein
VCVRARVRVCVHMHIFKCVCLYVHIFTYSHNQQRPRTLTHTHIHIPSSDDMRFLFVSLALWSKPDTLLKTRPVCMCVYVHAFVGVICVYVCMRVCVCV